MISLPPYLGDIDIAYLNFCYRIYLNVWYKVQLKDITYFLIIFQMETEEGEEMEVAADVVMIPNRNRSDETKSVSP